MDNSAIVLLINDDARVVSCEYEPDGPRTNFKTLDQTIAVDDLVVVQSGTRHGMTVVRVREVDLEVNFDTTGKVDWVVQPVDSDRFQQTLEIEKEAISAVQAAERKRKRDELRASLFANHEDQIKTLRLANTQDEEITEQP